MNLQDVSHIHIPDGDVRMIHDSDNRLLWGAVGYNVLFSGNTYQQSYTGKNLFNPAVYANVLGNNAVRTLGIDGSITWVNTTSDSYFPWIYSDSMFGTAAIRSATIPVQPSTQYTVSLKKTTATSIGLYIYEGDSDYVGIKNTYTTIRGDASYTFTTSETTRYVILRFAKWASQETDVLSEIQLEAGATATSYEPFVGAQPSPNPDYPQQIQTVTGEQTVTVTGKNLLNAVPYATPIQQGVEVTITNTNTIHIEGTSTQTYVNLTRIFSTNLPAGTYTMSINKELPFRVNLSTILSGGGSLDRSIQAGETSVTFTTSETTTGMRIFMSTGGAGIVFDETFTVQLVSGNAADYDFEPYSSANYPLNLGSLELCKLGTYQDYIWKDGNDWKVHKAIKKVAFSDVTNWSEYTLGSIAVRYFEDLQAAGGSSGSNPIVTNGFHPKFLIEENTCFLGSNNHRVCFCPLITLNWTNYISDNHPVVYYALATPTDTTITDTTLIAQLEAIYNLVRRYGYNFVVSVSGNNLPIIIDRTLL